MRDMLVEYFLGEKQDSQDMVKSSDGLFGGVRILGMKIRSAIRWTLGVKVQKKQVFPPLSSHRIVESFRVIGDELKLAYTVGKTFCVT